MFKLQLYGVDYEETFSPIADIRAIRILISIVAFYDYEIWQNEAELEFDCYYDADCRPIYIDMKSLQIRFVFDESGSTTIKAPSTPLRIVITELKNDADVDAFVNLGYQNRWGNEFSDAYSSSDDDLGFVAYHTKGDDNVVIKTLTTNDHFLNKFCSNSGHFRGFIDELVNANVQTVVEDTESIDP
ncbi:hypothetical protein Tco_1465130 [Tanacetum coccineum]